eukprot:TRINITY_DN9031_c0_g1_i1.p1 TRINITY_DN9031_c0_g1~~TRINITY_DN9031_c0_g1_i1.p1  ORF type:complete len:153 (+),score=9.19 TRINITY_DN9031_c0_g1_i1:305-763(+)
MSSSGTPASTRVSKAKRALPSRLPLVLSRSKRPCFLLEADSKSDLKGDVGVVGRLTVDQSETGIPIKLDLKGYVYEGDLMETNTFLVVEMSAGTDKNPPQATVTNVFNHTMRPKNIYSMLGTETVLEVNTEHLSIDATSRVMMSAAECCVCV